MINFEKFNVQTGGKTSGRMKTFCPQCRDRRSNKRDKSLSVNLDTGLAYCHYCNWTLNARDTKPAPRLPIAPPQTAVLAQEVVTWFSTRRAIPASTLIAAGITSAVEYMPQTRQKELCICFNYYEGNRLVNTKFRDLAKNFKLVAGAEMIPYNINGILGTEECIITEGEIDALSFMAIGRTDVISAPGGANRNLSWLDRFLPTHFDDKRVIYICTDTDHKGLELRDELLRRLGTERCRVVDLSPLKDANELLQQSHGADALKAALAAAPPAPLEGVYTADELSDELRALYENGLGSGAETGWENFDELCTFEPGRICVLTGIPGCGKSEFVDELVLRLNLRHHWRVAYFSPENMPMVYHLQKLAEKLTGRRFHKDSMSDALYRDTVEYLQENVVSILPKDDFTVDNIFSKARELIYRRGIRVFVIDPLNSIDHLVARGETETQYMNRFLNKLTTFARRNRCLVILVAHPRKMNRELGSKSAVVPDLYDISGSAAFFNKCDYGLVVERDREASVTRVHVEKVKFRHLGDKGTASFVFNANNGRFVPRGMPFDNRNWVVPGTSMAPLFENPQNIGCNEG
ncbi:toprim domain-containing protein [Bacteroides sp. 214]|uniref:bifunctional DNA primase/helicase n=1 Tax=Bacteroides sp. 214 TaxID=2302935 RepID=UPI0013D8954A|nr:bifunctional DNA primase/helicase [Bacteroides sp. 214]NDW13429.1 toprim domain-containing protein [Bacteroides sp. 214]